MSVHSITSHTPPAAPVASVAKSEKPANRNDAPKAEAPKAGERGGKVNIKV